VHLRALPRSTPISGAHAYDVADVNLRPSCSDNITYFPLELSDGQQVALLPWFPIPVSTHHCVDEQLENAFQALEQPQKPAALTSALESQAEEPQSQSDLQPQDADLLARTAGLLVQSVDHERNPKFANSQFLGLMKQLRDRTAMVQGNDIVSAPPDLQLGQGHTVSSVDPKGKGKAIPSFVAVTQGAGASQLQAPSSPLRMAEQDLKQDLNIGPEEDANDAYFRQDNEDYANYWNAHHKSVPPTIVAPSPEWQQLQRDWEKFEATSTGVRPLSGYQFQPGNPYLLGERSANHTIHTQVRSFSEVCNPHAACDFNIADYFCRVFCKWRRLYNGNRTTRRRGSNLASNSKKMSGSGRPSRHYSKHCRPTPLTCRPGSHLPFRTPTKVTAMEHTKPSGTGSNTTSGIATSYLH
jgi:hypothetical protein